MVLYVELVVLMVLATAFIVWFARTSLFRAHRHGHWKEPDQAGTGRSRFH
jgi:hypothetical protein